MRLLFSFIVLFLSQCLFAGQVTGPTVPTDLTIFTLPGGSYVGEDLYNDILNFADEDCFIPIRIHPRFKEQIKRGSKITEISIGKFNPGEQIRPIHIFFEGNRIYENGVLKTGSIIFECKKFSGDRFSGLNELNLHDLMLASGDVKQGSEASSRMENDNYNNSMSLVSQNSNQGYVKLRNSSKPASL